MFRPYIFIVSVFAGVLLIGCPNSFPISTVQCYLGDQVCIETIETNAEFVGTLIVKPHLPLQVRFGGFVFGSFDGKFETLHQTFSQATSQPLFHLKKPIQYEWRIAAHPAGPTCEHDDTVYELPYQKGASFALIQGENGSFTHFDEETNAYDFMMPEKTPIMAARGGKVIDAYDQSSETGDGKENNYVLIQHSDGTIGYYLHLSQKSLSVKVGDRVKTGQQLALSGNTGNSGGPHLHFHVSTPEPEGLAFKTFPLYFSTHISPKTKLLLHGVYRR